jgi:small subunit ribosomal protein S7
MRKRRAEKRFIKPDSKFNDIQVAKFINYIMIGGKKTAARKALYDSFEIIEQRTKTPALEVFKKAVSNVQPIVEVKSRRVGGATYQVPVEVRSDRRFALAFRWIRTYARSRGDKSMAEKVKDLRLKRKMIHIGWQKLIKHLHILNGNYVRIMNG